jgi:hypothetical protein
MFCIAIQNFSIMSPPVVDCVSSPRATAPFTHHSTAIMFSLSFDA